MAMRRVTQDDVAQRCGVTRSTVSLVFRNNPHIPEATAARVREAARELGYRPSAHQAARRLNAWRYGRTVRNRTILLLLPNNYHRAQYFARLLEGVQDTLMAERFLSIICTPDMLDYGLSALPPLLAEGEFDGILYFSETFCVAGTILPALHATVGDDIPTVGMLARSEAHLYDVCADEYLGAYLAVKHLLELGHRHLLLCLNDWELPMWAARKAGVEGALREWGLDPATALHPGAWYLGSVNPTIHLATAEGAGDNVGESAKIRASIDDMQRYLTTHREVTAIIAQNDAIARRIAYLLKPMGFRVPDDISLVGFDDTDPLLDEHGHNILTSVHIPLEAIGSAGARRLLDWILQQTPPDPMPAFTPELIVRGSTAPV